MPFRATTGCNDKIEKKRGDKAENMIGKRDKLLKPASVS